MRFSGYIGFSDVPKETLPGIHTSGVVEKPFTGELNRRKRSWNSGDEINDDINLSMEISVVAGPYVTEHLSLIKYIVYRGARWKVTDVDFQPPRLVLSIGGLYDGPIPDGPCY